VVANAGLDALLMLGLGHGGIALATSLAGRDPGVPPLDLSPAPRRCLRSRLVLGSLLVSSSAAALAFGGARVMVSSIDPSWFSEPLARLAACAVIGGAGYLVLQALFNRPVVRLIPAVLGRLHAGRP
jgi:hypothetical protein